MQNIEHKSTLNDPKVQAVLKNAYRNARGERIRMGAHLVLDKLLGRSPSIKKYIKRTKKMYIPLSKERGTFAYLLARAINAQRIVEFGTSFGVSTIYLAAAIKDNKGEIVIGSEIEETKAAKAQQNLEDAGLIDYVDVRAGDAQTTLKDPGGTVDMLLVDGFKDLYLPIVKILTPHLRSGSVVLGDNVTTPIMKASLASDVAFMNDAKNGFCSVTIPFKDGLEYSVLV
jgi:predicted O-methyltransferase YrrM